MVSLLNERAFRISDADRDAEAEALKDALPGVCLVYCDRRLLKDEKDKRKARVFASLDDAAHELTNPAYNAVRHFHITRVASAFVC